MNEPKYKRVVLKLSGEALPGDEKFGIKPPVIKLVLKWGWNVHKRIIWACWQQ